MLAIGRAMMTRPKILLLDEPSMGLAPIWSNDLRHHRRDQPRGCARLLVEQNALMALDVAHRGYVLETGKVALEGSAKEELAANEDGQEGLPGHRVDRSWAARLRGGGGSANTAARGGTRCGRPRPPARARARALRRRSAPARSRDAALPPHPGSRRRSRSPMVGLRADRLPVGIGQQRMAGPGRRDTHRARGHRLRPFAPPDAARLGIEPGASRLEERAVR